MRLERGQRATWFTVTPSGVLRAVGFAQWGKHDSREIDTSRPGWHPIELVMNEDMPTRRRDIQPFLIRWLRYTQEKISGGVLTVQLLEKADARYNERARWATADIARAVEAQAAAAAAYADVENLRKQVGAFTPEEKPIHPVLIRAADNPSARKLAALRTLVESLAAIDGLEVVELPDSAVGGYQRHHLCDEECGDPVHPQDGRLVPEH